MLVRSLLTSLDSAKKVACNRRARPTRRFAVSGGHAMKNKSNVSTQRWKGAELMRLLIGLLLLAAATAIPSAAQNWPRGRELGIPFTGQTGPLNAITDVPGVAVGHVTLIEGEGKIVPGKGPIRTGVTAILPRPRGNWDPVFAATYNQNG